MIRVNANLFIKQIFEFTPDGKDRTRVFLVNVVPIIVTLFRVKRKIKRNGACQIL